ncbi:hypothetical protein VP01_1061g2 [Puccinia sorghi]|uniref:Uncharacterized protein n=1 Tax=Puccinia sorghi TaxID=27349 RepID=A0A0L6VTV9_9BASI|nr:hypothetical protein VP01_1061g2 [Puccinia sorghi]
MLSAELGGALKNYIIVINFWNFSNSSISSWLFFSSMNKKSETECWVKQISHHQGLTLKFLFLVFLKFCYHLVIHRMKGVFLGNIDLLLLQIFDCLIIIGQDKGTGRYITLHLLYELPTEPELKARTLEKKKEKDMRKDNINDDGKSIPLKDTICELRKFDGNEKERRKRSAFESHQFDEELLLIKDEESFDRDFEIIWINWVRFLEWYNEHQIRFAKGFHKTVLDLSLTKYARREETTVSPVNKVAPVNQVAIVWSLLECQEVHCAGVGGWGTGTGASGGVGSREAIPNAFRAIACISQRERLISGISPSNGARVQIELLGNLRMVLAVVIKETRLEIINEFREYHLFPVEKLCQIWLRPSFCVFCHKIDGKSYFAGVGGEAFRVGGMTMEFGVVVGGGAGFC